MRVFHKDKAQKALNDWKISLSTIASPDDEPYDTEEIDTLDEKAEGVTAMGRHTKVEG